MHSQHVNREFYNLDGSIRKSDSGLWYQPFDFHGISKSKEYVPELANTPFTVYEKDSPYFGAPFLVPLVHLLDVR